jgi:hypothetical protein
MERKLDNFVISPRYLAEMLRKGEISLKEYLFIHYIRDNADPYGVMKTSMDALAYDLKEKKNYTNRLLLSLKSKRLIDYQSRAGFRGSFSIYLDFWTLPNKEIKERGVFYLNRDFRGFEGGIEEKIQENSQRSERSIQRSKELKSLLKEAESAFSLNSKFRGTKKENEKEKDTLTEDFPLKEERTSSTEGGIRRTYYDSVSKRIVENS